MKIGIVAAGYVGNGLARLFAKHGHEGMVSYSRYPQKLQCAVNEAGPNALA
jgi:predicted dinucleotide-binding enzyme